jgi:hypothetical protein
VAPQLGPPAIKSDEWYTQMRDRASVVEWPTLLGHGAVIGGESDFVTEQLAELKEVTDIDPLLCWIRLGGLSDAWTLGHMERMRDSVMTALR